MTESLAHRGPDAQNTIVLPGCEMGHTRLSIIDLSTGSQPMTDPSGQFTLVFNGEIYNYRELRRELSSLGHRFVTTSDTEVLLHAAIEFAEETPTRLIGQFAFALWNAKERSLLIARDRFGEKPLYWANGTGGQWIFASEIKAILASGCVDPRIDRLSVDAYLGLFYVPPDRTIYENVHTLSPGQLAIWKDDRLSAVTYWQPQIGQEKCDANAAVEEIRRRLDRAVSRQMVADVPVGAFLSGGLDSTTIVALMQQHASTPISTFAAGFGKLIDELPFARQAAKLYQTDHHEIQIEIDVPAMLKKMNAAYDEPFADSSNIPTFLLSQYARQSLKVVLSGDGGDELLGGYEWYRSLLSEPQDRQTHYAHLTHASHLAHDRRGLWGEYPPDAMSDILACYRSSRSGIDAAVEFDCRCYLPGDILVKVDRAAMANGLETRAPFLDVELAEFILSLPAELRFGDTRLKGLLRSACENLWPIEIRKRSKQGFGAPVRSWLEIPEVSAMWDSALRPGSALIALLPGVSQLPSGEAAKSLSAQKRWTLLCLSQWLESRTACLANLK